MERGIRNSGKALIIRDGKMLAVKLQDADGMFYIMPGGGDHGLYEGKPHPVYLGYKSMGDPEATD